MKKTNDDIKITLSSPENTPEEEKIYVVEYPTTSRIKVRETDIDSEIESIDADMALKLARKNELLGFKEQINKLK